ncbi:Predicted PurR-regulated permease PerM [Natronobacterium texcoconense]|uniref:Predicted PurR-regulated permease PerM n=1 Tax=Natronobacterium texcoconense TaxID=1095778 RepID=A0A1H1GXB0_NATTX|nr:AI-2E family transporter [Natronobacterium texcoconense]SDR17476.1 Predicted PurR-regulated permease PerM [Natronobacterium texcoconense]
MNEKRTVVALFGVGVAAVTAYVAYRFVAALTVAIFLYYSTRRFYHFLERFKLPDRVRAVLVLSLLALPLLGLLSYTVLLLAVELQNFVETYQVTDSVPEDAEWIEALDNPPELTLQGLFAAYESGTFDPLIDYAVDHTGFLADLVAGFLLNLLITVVVTYYLLIDGSNVHEWLLRFDDDAIVREYLEAVDEELEAVLFGNLLNVILISVVAVVTFMGYNVAAPSAVEIPYPALAGALTGIASLIPVVGMKIVYVPVAIAAAVPVAMNGDLGMLAYVAGFLLLAVVVVDTIPDLVVRPYLSGKRTHVGLLMLAYIFGPVVFGFHGLFLAPIILVVGLTFADTALPRLLGADEPAPALEDLPTLDEESSEPVVGTGDQSVEFDGESDGGDPPARETAPDGDGDSGTDPDTAATAPELEERSDTEEESDPEGDSRS